MVLPASALIVVDVQSDFCPGGSLAVPNGNEIIEVINRTTDRISFPAGVFFSKDWHPQDHISFASNHPGKKPFEQITLPDGTPQTLWPDHCVQGSPGAEFASGLKFSSSHDVVLKGMDRRYDSYSAFFDNVKQSQTKLYEELKSAGVKTVYICGLALDICVLYTALDAASLGLNTVLLEDACRGLSSESNAKALETMKEAGVTITKTDDLE